MSISLEVTGWWNSNLYLMDAYTCICACYIFFTLKRLQFIIKELLRLASKSSKTKNAELLDYTKGCMCPFDYVLCWSNKKQWSASIKDKNCSRFMDTEVCFYHQCYHISHILNRTHEIYINVDLNGVKYKLPCQNELFSTVHLEVWVMVCNSHMPKAV